MNILLPVSLFRVDFEVAVGRPYSGFEWTVLRAVGQGECTISALQKVTGVHPRLIVEALVTLARAGWIAVGSGQQPPFMLTSEGRYAIDTDDAPKSLQVSQRTELLVMERLTGALVNSFKIQFASKQELQKRNLWHCALCLPAAVADNRIGEAEVQHLLPRGHGEWLRWVGPILMLSKGKHWVSVSSDSQGDRLLGLPDTWQLRLRGPVLDNIRLHRDGEELRLPQSEQRPPAPVIPSQLVSGAETLGRYRARIQSDDLLLSPAAHVEYLTMALSEASSFVLVSSAFVNTPSLEYLRAPLLDALGRGVDIDLLWGYGAPPEALEILSKLRYDARQGKGTLSFNGRATQSHAKLLIVDRPSGVEAVVGSYNWLSAIASSEGRPSKTFSEISIRVRHPGIISDLCRGAVDPLRAIRAERLSPTADRWRRRSAELACSVAADQSLSDGAGEANAELYVIYDRSHEHLMRMWYAEAKQRFTATSHRLGPVVETRLAADAPSGRSSTFSYRVVYGLRPDSAEVVDRAVRVVQKGGGELIHRANMHAKVVIADGLACISSYNFLSADPFLTSKSAREVGLVLIGDEPANWLQTALINDQDK